MPRKKKTDPREVLITAITESLIEKKAKDPVVLDFSSIPGAAFDAFVICHGTSRTHVESLADFVMKNVRKTTGVHAWHSEGFENAEWILIDYGDVVVHIFQDSRRNFYNLEQLWADAETKRISTEK